MRALIIEPDFLLAKVYKKVFEKRGFVVGVAHGAQDAVKVIDLARPDCIILELQLGGHSGVEFLHEFRSYEDWANIPLYIYSGISLESLGQVQKNLSSLGVRRYFYKSITPIDQLAGTIMSDLEG